jgi:phosphoinositide-3-kinase regulatory subunit 4
MCTFIHKENFGFLCVAVDRFIRTLNPDGSSQVLLPEESLHKGDLTPAMDIFSAGCALAELFNEVHDAPFDLSEMLAYCSSEDNDFKHLDNLEDPDIRVNFASYYSFPSISSRNFDCASQ